MSLVKTQHANVTYLMPAQAGVADESMLLAVLGVLTTVGAVITLLFM